jgi:hypothetical protein
MFSQFEVLHPDVRPAESPTFDVDGQTDPPPGV